VVGARVRLPAALLALCLTGACASGGVATGSGGSAAPLAGSGDPRLLRGVCQDRIVVQSNWFPTGDVGALYQSLGGRYQVDPDHKLVSGPLVARGVDTGVTLEVRSGGPAIGFQAVPAQMYADPSITLGVVITDEAILYSARQPTLGVVAPLDGDPQIILWDPATHRDWNTLNDIGQTDTTVVYYQGNTFMEYLIGSGILRRSQVDGSYDGTPSRFVASGGKIAIQGYATNEPYVYQHEVRAWRKPVAYALVQDTNYPNYADTLAIRPADRPRLDGCLRKLVPILQGAQVDFLAHPEPALRRIVEIVRAYHAGFTYSQGNAEFAVRQLRSLGLVGNGSNNTLGDFDTDRLQRMLNIVVPIVKSEHKPVKDRLTPTDIATNDYLDHSIGLPR
jgi:hypothetical protein